MLGIPSFPATASPQRQGTRNKVALSPGRSLMDWVRLTKGAEDIQGFKGRTRPITKEELARHNTQADCWVAIRGRVYNVTRYLEYHPGGIDELMKGAGKDATELFDAVHRWVNFNSMLAKCFIGPLKYETKILPTKINSTAKKEHVFLAPTIIPLPRASQNVIARYDWYEKEAFLVVSIYSKLSSIHSSDVIIDCENGRTLNVKLLMEDKYFCLHQQLKGLVKDVKLLRVSPKKIDLKITKSEENEKWNQLGIALDGDDAVKNNDGRELKFRDCPIVAIDKVTHNTRLYTVELPPHCYYEAPVGHHVQVKGNVNDMEVVRNYTVTVPLDENCKSLAKKGKHLQLMIKHYSDGALTPLLHALKTGDTMCVSDCIGTFKRAMLKDKSSAFLIAAGTGLTPMIGIMNHYLYEAAVKCHVKLLFANKEEKDILWKNIIDELEVKIPAQFNATYVLSEPDSMWTGHTGRVNREMLEMFISKNDFPASNLKDSSVSVNPIPHIDGGKLFAVCGPTEFTLNVQRILLEMGISDADIHCFLG